MSELERLENRSSITARQTVAGELPDSESHYRTLFDNAPDAILIVDMDSMAILDANAAASRLFGYSPAELTRMMVTDLSLEPVETKRTVADAVAFIPRRRLRRKDGTEFLAEVTSSRNRFDDTNARVSFVRDITDRVAAESARDASETKFAAAFAASPDAVNINRMEDGLYVEVNDGFTRLTGWTAAETIGKTSGEIQIWESLQDRSRMVAQLRDSGRVDNFEAGFRNKDGSLTVALMSARIIDFGGVPHILSVTRDISDRKRSELDLAQSNMRLAEMVLEITRTLGRVVEIRDPYTHGHQERVALVARAIATEMGMSADDVDAIEMSALVHDVGKLSVPAEILNKPGALSDAEFGLIKSHSQRGYEILKGVEFPWPMADIVLQHHERQDGSGYPQGLVGDEILPAARILAIADVVEAMASYRPYRPALGLAAAVDEIQSFPEKYDADARTACLALHARGELAFLDM
ncbi:MAG: PAS domain S-box protein [Coriobacteriia bacterium]|nr:PAS domain S-box protein [Coriobacteriia bacterium]